MKTIVQFLRQLILYWTAKCAGKGSCMSSETNQNAALKVETPKEETSTLNEAKQPRRYRLKKEDISSQRYECFCSKQYLSYCALNGHVKSKHKQFYQTNKRYISNIVETIDPIYNYKIKKLLKERVQFHSAKDKPQRKQKDQPHKKQPPRQDTVKQDYISIQANPPIKQPGSPPQTNSQTKSKQEVIERLQNQLLKQKQSRIDQLREENDGLKRHLLICDRKKEKGQQIITQLQKIVTSYELILRNLKIEPILQMLDRMDTCKIEE